MTREEMFVHLNALKHITDKSSMMWLALDMAIKALEQEHCEDVISRAEVLKKAVYSETEEGWSGYTVDVEDIKDLPSVQPQPKTGHWIPVSERLPKYNKTVLISVKQQGKEEMVFTAQRRRRVKTPDIFKCCTDYDGWWDFSIAAWDNHEVLAWMPLPEPYKAESEVQE